MWTITWKCLNVFQRFTRAKQTSIFISKILQKNFEKNKAVPKVRLMC